MNMRYAHKRKLCIHEKIVVSWRSCSRVRATDAREVGSIPGRV